MIDQKDVYTMMMKYDNILLDQKEKANKNEASKDKNSSRINSQS